MEQQYTNKQKDFEERQYQKLSKLKELGRYKNYFIVLLALILMVDIIDNITTNANNAVTSSFIKEFFINGHLFGNDYDLASGLALHNTISLIGHVIGLLTPFYKSLGDKYGRKPLFVLSTLGMTFGLLIVYFSKSYLTFMIGTFTMSFFLGHDIQIIYILEEAPAKHRATVYSIIKGIGGLSTILLPIMRESLMRNDDTLWRNIYILPGIAGLVVCLLVLIFAKETNTYINGRLEYLQVPYEERIKQEEQLKKEKKANGNKAGIFNAVSYIFKNKDLRTLILIKSIFDAAIIAVTNYEPIMNEAGMSAASITEALYYYPIIYCVAVIISGFMADKIGRKKTILIFGSITFVGFALFTLTTRNLADPKIIGLFYGLYLGGYWIGRDYMEIISTEMVPTDIRASIVGAEGLLVYVGMGIGLAVVNIGMIFIPIWLTCLVWILPCVGISLYFLSLKVKETKGIDYESIK